MEVSLRFHMAFYDLILACVESGQGLECICPILAQAFERHYHCADTAKSSHNLIAIPKLNETYQLFVSPAHYSHIVN